MPAPAGGASGQEPTDTSLRPPADPLAALRVRSRALAAVNAPPLDSGPESGLSGAIELDQIVVRGAQQHNLKNIDLTIPRGQFVVITGVSGSGKSSLAFDTIYAEGQRRYIESLSPFVRHFLEKIDKPKVSSITGLSPAIAIEQKTVSKNPRSTVGTITEVLHHLRLLYSRIGTAHCLTCGTPIQPLGTSEIVEALLALPPGSRFDLLVQRAGPQLFEQCRVPEQPDSRLTARLMRLVRTAFEQHGGVLIVELDDGERLRLTNQKICVTCGTPFPELSSQHFSPNTPLGMCQTCQGWGTRLEADPARVLHDPRLSLLDGALAFYGNVRKKKTAWILRQLHTLADHYAVDLEQPWQNLPPVFREALLYGSRSALPEPSAGDGLADDGDGQETVALNEGILNNVNRRFITAKTDAVREWMAQFMSRQPCPDCHGARLGPAARAVTLGNKTLPAVNALSIDQVVTWLDTLDQLLNAEERLIAGESLKEVRSRLRFIIKVGLPYLTLDRAMPSLSGGEAQRIRLASQLGSNLVGVLYVLDEPSIGLHARDQQTLLDSLLHLRDMGNSLLVVEHDLETMRQADWLIDMGPGAGALGGEVVASGAPQAVAQEPHSLTGQYLRGSLNGAASAARHAPGQKWLVCSGARLHNLKHVTARFPLGLLICVTGVSGSGKSSLINGTLYPALRRVLHHAHDQPGPYDHLDGLEYLNKVISVTQESIGRTPRSNPATYVGIFDDIRALFAGTAEAQALGYQPSHFSFNVKGGRCEACQGFGQQQIEMHFLPDVWMPCKECGGTRFEREVLAVRYRTKHIADVLDMDVAAALDLFADHPQITRILQTLHDVGLDYLKLGQSATALSGGEAQRLKLAKELSRVETGRTLYILDEPTTGLHMADIHRLMAVLHKLVEAGNTVLVVEHNLDVIKTADWVIDLGPEGGVDGGYLVAEGPPEAVAQVATSYTGRELSRVL